jgi:hypothetical protein
MFNGSMNLNLGSQIGLVVACNSGTDNYRLSDFTSQSVDNSYAGFHPKTVRSKPYRAAAG